MTIPARFGQTGLALVMGFLLLAARPATWAQPVPSPKPKANPGEVPPPQTGPTADSYVVSATTNETIDLAGEEEAANAGSSQPPLMLAEFADGPRLRTAKGDYLEQLFYGLSLAAAYSTDYSGVGTPSQVFGTISPYLGLLLPTRTGSLFLQYDAVINPYDTNVKGADPQAYHEFSLTAQGAFNRRWFWKAVGSGGYGSEALRMEGPLTFAVVGSVPVLNAGSTVLLPTTNVLFAANSAELVFEKDKRNTFAFTLHHTYTGVDADPTHPSLFPGGHSNTAGARVDYTHLVSTRLSLSTYGEEQTLFGSPTCYGYGGGVGITVGLSHSVSFEAGGGPQFTTSGCGSVISGDFMAAITWQLRQRDRAYATVSRTFTSAYQVHGTWQDTAAVGFAKNAGRSTLAIDAGWVRQTFVGTPAYQGYFVAPRYHFKFTNSLGFTAGYRALWVSGGGIPSGTLHFASVSLDWYPAGLRLK